MSITHSVLLPTKVFRFKSWSRKSYAAFNSLHIVVNIGSLVISISDRIGQKLKAFRALIHSQIIDGNQKEKPDDEELISNLINTIFLFEILNITGNERFIGCRFKAFQPNLTLLVLPSFYSISPFHTSEPIPLNTVYFQRKIFINYISNFCEHAKSSCRTDYAVSA